eukprot:2288653-Rhodomonas_salina.2
MSCGKGKACITTEENRSLWYEGSDRPQTLPPDWYTFIENEDCYATHTSHVSDNKVKGLLSGTKSTGGVTKKVWKAEPLIQAALADAKHNMMQVIPNWQRSGIELQMTAMLTYCKKNDEVRASLHCYCQIGPGMPQASTEKKEEEYLEMIKAIVESTEQFLLDESYEESGAETTFTGATVLSVNTLENNYKLKPSMVLLPWDSAPAYQNVHQDRRGWFRLMSCQGIDGVDLGLVSTEVGEQLKLRGGGDILLEQEGEGGKTGEKEDEEKEEELGTALAMSMESEQLKGRGAEEGDGGTGGIEGLQGAEDRDGQGRDGELMELKKKTNGGEEVDPTGRHCCDEEEEAVNGKESEANSGEVAVGNDEVGGSNTEEKGKGGTETEEEEEVVVVEVTKMREEDEDSTGDVDPGDVAEEEGEKLDYSAIMQETWEEAMKPMAIMKCEATVDVVVLQSIPSDSGVGVENPSVTGSRSGGWAGSFGESNSSGGMDHREFGHNGGKCLSRLLDVAGNR